MEAEDLIHNMLLVKKLSKIEPFGFHDFLIKYSKLIKKQYNELPSGAMIADATNIKYGIMASKMTVMTWARKHEKKDKKKYYKRQKNIKTS